MFIIAHCSIFVMAALNSFQIFQILVFLSLVLFCFVFWLCHGACGILVPWAGIRPKSLAVKMWNPKHWTTREFLLVFFSHLSGNFPGIGMMIFFFLILGIFVIFLRLWLLPKSFFSRFSLTPYWLRKGRCYLVTAR